MNLWLGCLVSVSICLGGVLLGHLLSRLPKRFWLAGYFIGFGLLMVHGIACWCRAWFFAPGISWMMMGRWSSAIFGLLVTTVLTTPLSGLRRKRDRVLIILLMALVVFGTSVLPFLSAAMTRNQLVHLQTHMGAKGVCLQSTGFTCGPAAAVTALRKLGLPADEGDIALLAGTSEMTGTQPDILAEVLRDRYGKDGLTAEFRAFKDIAELQKAGLTLACVKYEFLVDHVVTVLEVTDSEVIIGDPLNGLDRLTYDQFRREWRYTGVVLQLRQKPGGK